MSTDAPLATLDLISAKLHRDARPLDFSAILELDADEPFLARLKAGAESAGRIFPSAISRVEGKQWASASGSPLASISAPAEDVDQLIADFVNAGLNPHEDMQVRQLLVHPVDGGRPLLVSRFHHCAFDGTSAALWLFHQLMVASGQVSPEETSLEVSEPRLKMSERAQRKAPSAHAGASRRLFTSRKTPGRTRAWCSLDVDAGPIRAVVRDWAGVTYNDFLATHYLEALAEWNRQHDRLDTRMSVWLPINIRQQAFVGFGNGSSRIRVYRDALPEGDTRARCEGFRAQVEASRAAGEWHVPDISGLKRLPSWLLGLLLRVIINRPGVDMGSAPFTHMEGIGEAAAFTEIIRSARWVMMLDPRHPLGIAAATMGTQTRMTLTYDPGMLPRADAEAFLGLYQDLLKRGLEEAS